jgi:1-acyl-sn-glycerol-3-phosphate acyltransferase
MVEGMIRRSVRRSFRRIAWIPPAAPLTPPIILVPNHHGWHDGYVMYLAARALQLPILDWIAEYDAFPLFRTLGGMPFPPDDAVRRAATIRRTIRLRRDEQRNLILFAEGELHRPPELLPFGKALELVVRQVPNATVIPVAIRYEIGLHERPECFLTFGKAIEPGPDLALRTRLAVRALLDQCGVLVRFSPEHFTDFHPGTLDVNERMDMRNAPWSKAKKKHYDEIPSTDHVK